jgi:hypothetical protein
MTLKNDYSLFGLKKTEVLSEKDLKKIWRNLQRIYHPNKGGNETIFKKLEPAYKRILKTLNAKKPNAKKSNAKNSNAKNSNAKNSNAKKSNATEPKIPHKHQLGIKRYFEKKGCNYVLIEKGEIFDPKHQKEYVKIGIGRASKRYKFSYKGKSLNQGNANSLYTAIANNSNLCNKLKDIPEGSNKLNELLDLKFLLLDNKTNLISELKKQAKLVNLTVKSTSNKNLTIKYKKKGENTAKKHSVNLNSQQVLITKRNLEAPDFLLNQTSKGRNFKNFRNQYFTKTTKKGVWKLRKVFGN